MFKEYEIPSCGGGKLHCYLWLPEGQPRAIVQVVHGIAEYVNRYDGFARWLNERQIAVVGEDHMGHGKSIPYGTQGYFNGGWFAAAADTYALMRQTMEAFPGVPYFLLGHSMGSFMARTILAKYPDNGLRGCILSGTAWQPQAILQSGKALSKLICKVKDETLPSPVLQGIAFGGYNARIEHPRTDFDWLNRVDQEVDIYVADPLCGFVASAGLLRDMMEGISYIQQDDSLAAMNKKLPVLFAAGSADPVGNYGKGVQQAAEAFRCGGMEQVDVKLYPLCRHEILLEMNRLEVFEDILDWILKYL